MRKLKISHYLMIIFLILSFTINGVITVIFYHTASNQVMQDMKRRLFDIVSISAGHVNGDLHHDLLSLYQQAPQAMAQESATYLELKQSLQQIQDASNDIHFIYTMREKPAENGAARQIMFMVDAESDLQQMAQLGEIYSDASPMLSARFFDLQGPAIEEAVYQDHWGTWLSGYAPFFDSRGQRAGVLGVDISAETIATYQHRILMNSLIFFLWTLPFVMAAALLLGRWFGSPMAMMQRGAEAIASGQLDHRLDIPPGRELAVLAHSMNHMAKSLQQERHNLQTLLTKYRNIFQNATEGIFQSTLDGRLLTANDALVKMLGYDSLDELQHAIDHHIANIYENHDDRRKLIQQLTDRGQVTGVKMRMVRRDGVVFVAEENVHLCDYGGEQEEKTVIEGTIRDITQRIERERAEREKEAALASSRAKSEFLANMSHEIRTPLNAVMGLTDLMRRTILSDIQQQYLQKITISSKSLLAVINDILDFSKIEAGRLELEKAPFSLYDVMTNVSEMFAYKAEEKGLEFLVSIEENLPAAVIGDSVRLGQVLINLVGNAVKFTEQGEVVVRVEISPVTHPADQFTFSVLDTGIGIPENRIEVLFDSFTQADGSITRKHGGTGLGLTISRRLVRLMGGDITVTSALEKGSVFSFTIPLEHQPKKNQIVLQPPRDLRGLRVLIVDDNQTSLDILASIIRSFQMEAVTASSGKKALDILMTHPPDSPFDLVLLDWKMPGINGLEAARKIKLDMSLDKMPVVCMISAHAREDLIQQADRKFLDAFLHKPVNQSFLFDTIMELFGRHDALVTRKLGMDSPQTDPHFFDHLQGKQILLVEDNEINRDVAMEWLHNVGILVKVAKNGKEALVCLGIDGTNRENTALKPPDAVLMDIQMPDMDGLEATRHIRECARFQSLPIIAMTAHALKGDREKCIDAGMNDYITKPIDPNIMFQTLVQWTTPASEGHGKPFPASPKPALSTIPLPPSDQKQELDASVRGKKQSRPDVSATVLPEIELPGIDVALGLFRANHNRTLYHKLIKTFVRDFGDAETGIYALLSKDRVEPDDRDAARITVHSIKGVSANIGAEDLARAAAGLEQVLIAAHEFDLKNLFTTGIWSQFRTELRQVITGIRTYLSVAEKADEISNNTRAPEQKHRKELELDGGLVHTEPTVDVSELIKALERIDAMLDDDLGAARDELACIEKVLEDLVDKALFRNLMDAMDDFDIDDVSDIIRQMSRSLAQKMAPP